jgi:hypothetical protein
MPGGSGNQVEKLIDPVAFPAPPGQNVKNGLTNQTQPQHFNDGASRADQKQ